MARRGTLYRCHLFSFGGPQTEGVASRWTQNLEPIGDREVLSGETVEMTVTVDATSYILDANTRVRFDILEEDHLLTGGLDDRIISLVGTNAPNPEEGFAVRNVTTQFYSLDAEQSLTDFIRNFQRTYRDTYQDQILILEHQREGEQAYLILAWWSAERLEDFANSEFYFIINVDDQFEDQTEQVLDVSRQWTTGDPSSVPDPAELELPRIADVRWATETAEPGEIVSFEITGRWLQPGIYVAAQVLDDVGQPVWAVDVPIRSPRGPHLGFWRVPEEPAARYRVRAHLAELTVESNIPLEVRKTIRLRIQGAALQRLTDVRFRLFDRNGELIPLRPRGTGGRYEAALDEEESPETITEGCADVDGLIEVHSLPGSAEEIEIDGVEIAAVNEPPPSDSQLLLPRHTGRIMRFIALREEDSYDQRQ